MENITSRKKRLAPLVAASLLMIALVAAIWFTSTPGYALSTDQPSAVAIANQDLNASLALEASGVVTVYLPFVASRFPPPPPTFGVQIGRSINSTLASRATNAGAYWVRFDAFHWDDIEPVRTAPPTYNWNTGVEASLKQAAANGLEVIAAIKYTPAWAQKVAGSFCGPIKEDSLDEFAQFVRALVKRYSAAPYNVHYWELGNEPDVDPALVEAHKVFGCWGDEGDDYYGGAYYAEMLKRAYPAIKAADPMAQVLIGGLLLDCDWTHSPEGKDCKPSKFLEGILRNGGGAYFDIVSFHGYPQYWSSLQSDEGFPSWDARGGVVLGKADFLRSVLASYGVNKPLFHTEGGLICSEKSELCNPPDAAFYEAQADYVVWLYVRNWAAGVMGTIWYQLDGPGWRYGSLLDGNQNPKPAYNALSFLTTELSGAAYQHPLALDPEQRVLAYEFGSDDKRIWVLWARDEQPHVVTLPGGVVHVYDKYGGEVTVVSGELTVKSPVYVELVP